MSKTLVLLYAAALVAGATVASVFYLSDQSSVVNVSFIQSASKLTVHTPPASRQESFILSTTASDGTSADDVDMRDGRTKQYSFDVNRVLRHASVYYKGPAPDKVGPLQYEKFHNAAGHLQHEDHWRPDGSLEMQGQLVDQIYVRQVFYPGPSRDPHELAVATQYTFDMSWKHLTQTDYRLDRSVAAQHTWDAGDETVKHFAEDGVRPVLLEVNKGWSLYQGFYYPDGSGLKVDELNSGAGTIYVLYNSEHKATMKLYYDNSRIDHFEFMDAGGNTEWRQLWVDDYSKPSVDGDLQRRLVYIEHVRPDGKLAGRYSFDRDGHLTSVTIMAGDAPLGARHEFEIDANGFAKSDSTYNETNFIKSKVELTAADNVRFDLPASVRVRPNPAVPPVPKGFNLYGVPPQMGPH